MKQGVPAKEKEYQKIPNHIKKMTQSSVEQYVLLKTDQKIIYPPTEKIKTLIVENFPHLGQVTALRFLEWAQNNEGGVISLPTGKTPEYFIKWVQYYLKNWRQPAVARELEQYGLDISRMPDMKSFYFVQIDEFYPIHAHQHNSFYYYVNKFYIKGFGLDPEKALLINPDKIGLKDNETLEEVWPDYTVDLTLRTRHPKTRLEMRQKEVIHAIDEFCYHYEKTIEDWGGIGFFLGGIGPDGHIGFNVAGSSHLSVTRLTPTNYETQAAAATDLGGIEISRKRLVITIGLQTIRKNPDVTAIIFAAGEAKARIVRDAIQSEPSLQIPATSLHGLKNARFYLTQGAAKLLDERRYAKLQKTNKIPEQEADRIIIDFALKSKSSLNDIDFVDIKKDREVKLLIKKNKIDLKDYVFRLREKLEKRLIENIKVPSHQVFLHTAPHHDDIMLAYLPLLVRLMRDQTNKHYFNYLTSGFTAVTNNYMLQLVQQLLSFMKTPGFHQLYEENYFDPANPVFRNHDVLYYLDGIAAANNDMQREAESRRMMRNVIEIFEEVSLPDLRNRILEMENYFKTQYPGKKDIPHIQKLKGMTREWEADVLWGYFGFNTNSVIHSRLGFYKGDIFTENPRLDRDVLPILDLLKKIQPTIITVAFDPEGSGPDTHYKVLQAITTALKIYTRETGRKDIKVWGYRNVWYRFHPSEANRYIPVTLNSLSILQNAFMISFRSQASASFPSYEYDGPFSELAQKIQVEQYRYFYTLLGEEFFYENPDSRIRSTRGLVFLREMNLDEFFELSAELQKSMENIE